MKWLTFDLIKQQLRLDDTIAEMERDLLELYGESAEDTVLNACHRSITDVYEQYGCIPKAFTHAALMLVSLSYQQREPISPTNMYVVPYSFDLMVKPYIRLTDNTTTSNKTENRYGCKNL